MEIIKFEELQLDERILRAVADMGFEEASPIQGQAIPLELAGQDLIGQAQTGTGKTAAFGIPLLQRVDPKSKKTAGNCPVPDQRTGNPGGRRGPESGKIYARCQGTSGLWRSGDQQADPLS